MANFCPICESECHDLSECFNAERIEQTFPYWKGLRQIVNLSAEDIIKLRRLAESIKQSEQSRNRSVAAHEWGGIDRHDR
jgi:hypothetical protein